MGETKEDMLKAMVTEEVKFRRKNIGYRNWWNRSQGKRERCAGHTRNGEKREENIWKGREN